MDWISDDQGKTRKKGLLRNIITGTCIWKKADQKNSKVIK